MVDVFISYARSDQSEAERLAKRLTALGLEVWLDRGLTPGLDYAREIAEKLHTAAVIVVCWSATSAKSRWVFAEAMAGLHRANLVPIALDGTIPPTPFTTLQAIPLQRWAGRARHPGWRALLERIGTLMGKSDLAQKDLAYAQGRRPGKALIACVDNGWLTSAPTNPALVREVIARTDSEQRQQLVRYILDFDTISPITAQMKSLMFGYRGDAAMFEGYLFLIDNFDDGDRIYLFGAGLGGATARRLAQLITKCGIVRRDRTHAIAEAFRLFRQRKPAGDAALAEFRAENCHLTDTDGLPDGVPPIAYVGLWDSVVQRNFQDVLGSLVFLGPRHDFKLAPNVRAARQAVALDEKRVAFPYAPIEHAAANGAATESWFPGRTEDITGGFGGALSADPFLWIMEGAEEAGLDLDRASERLLQLQEARKTLDASTPFRKVSTLGMTMPINFVGAPRRGPRVKEQVSATAIERWRNNRRYRPASLRHVRRELHAMTLPGAMSDE